MFTVGDIACMHNWFDLSNYEDVKANTEKILERLDDGSMPMGGAPWTEEQINKFRRWIDERAKP